MLVTIGYQYSPRERIFEAVIDQVEVMQLADLSPRDIKHDNPEFRRHEELINFLEQIYGRSVSLEDIVTVVRFSQILDKPGGDDRGDQGLRRRAELTRPPALARARPLRQAASAICCAESPAIAPDLLYIEVNVGTLPPRVPTRRLAPRRVPGRQTGSRTL